MAHDDVRKHHAAYRSAVGAVPSPVALAAERSHTSCVVALMQAGAKLDADDLPPVPTLEEVLQQLPGSFKGSESLVGAPHMV